VSSEQPCLSNCKNINVPTETLVHWVSLTLN
jgi:hypothetical protein